MLPRLPAAFALALLLLTAPLGAQDPPPAPVLKLVSPTIVAIGDMATVSVDPSSNVQGVKFTCVPHPSPTNWTQQGDSVSFVCGADCPKGGTFTVVAAGTLNGEVIFAEAVVTFGIPTPPPPPPPVPPPGPTPPPTPLASHLWLVTVFDTTKPDPAITGLIADSPFWFGVAKAGHQFANYDASADAAKAKPYVDYAASAGIKPPFVLFMDADTRKVLAIKPFPIDKDGISAEIDTLTQAPGRST